MGASKLEVGSLQQLLHGIGEESLELGVGGRHEGRDKHVLEHKCYEVGSLACVFKVLDDDELFLFSRGFETVRVQATDETNGLNAETGDVRMPAVVLG